ncbi:hypothetical protein ACA910_002417 [Epithemia clementina (nom. ined.)]
MTVRMKESMLSRNSPASGSRQINNKMLSFSMVVGRVTLMVFLIFSTCCHGFMPTAEVDVFLSDAPPTLSKYTLLASQASFGSYPPMRGSRRRSNDGGDDDANSGHSELLLLKMTPEDNPTLCSPPSSTRTLSATRNGKASNSNEKEEPFIMLVPRGDCTFETKAYHAEQLGAKAVIVYGALSSRYSLNTTTDDQDNSANDMDKIIWPIALQDYDCDKGSALIPEGAISFDTLPYDSKHNDPLLSGETSQNMCRQKSSDSLKNCPSKACLLSGRKDESSSSWEACCAWDLHFWMTADDTFLEPNSTKSVSIPAVYVTLREGQNLIRDWTANSNVRVALYERWRPFYNPSPALIWMLAVAVAAVAAHVSASDYHSRLRHVLRAKERGLPNDDDDDNTSQQDQQRRPSQQQRPQRQEETLELNAWHAVGFVVMASTSLLVLFYFKIYGFVKVMYALGCSKALGSILLSPLIERAMNYWKIPNRVLWDIEVEDIGEITFCDVMAYVTSYSFGVVWLVMAFSYYHPETITFFWVMQDIFGACMCIMFLQVVKLNSIRVATILLVIAFFYDIFFVFISPLFFSKSVMLDVATSGGPPPNPEWCEKYPDDPVNCQQRGNPLPMLFTIPRIADYQGGANLLGLGDVVVPGLLISFAARFDAAKKLLGVMGGGNGSLGRSYACPEQKYCGSTCCNGGYYFPVVVAYAIGLLMANAAVNLMEMGQPALLYLVPCCLGMVLFIGWRRRELSDLWDGPRVIRAADSICYGEQASSDTSTTNSTMHVPLPQHDDDDDDKKNNETYHDLSNSNNQENIVDSLALPSATEDDSKIGWRG